MKILYVGSLAIPLRDILTGKTEKEITGWPAYFFPIYELIKRGHDVDFVFYSDLNEYEIRVDWFDEKQIVSNVYIDEKKRSRFGVFSKVWFKIIYDLKFLSCIHDAIKKKQYDFVYCQEINGFWGNVVANRLHVPCGVRFYGDAFGFRNKIFMKYEFIKKHGKLGLFLLRPKIYILYKLKKEFVLTTDDGSHGDLTYKMLKSSKTSCDFYFWKTGVNKNYPTEDSAISQRVKGSCYIMYPARIDPPKRQDEAIQVLSFLHQKGYKVHLYIIGQISNQQYYSQLLSQIHQSKLDDYVSFTFGITQNQVKIFGLNSVATILTGDYSNRGNTFFELFSIGVPIISFDDGSLNNYITNNETGFLVNDVKEMADCVIRLMNEPELATKISNNSRTKSEYSVLSIDDRFSLEVDLLEKYAEKRSDLVFPSKL